MLSSFLNCYRLDLPDSDMRKTTSELALDELGLQGSPKLWIGTDYANFIAKDFQNLNKIYQGMIVFLVIRGLVFSGLISIYVLAWGDPYNTCLLL